MTEFDIQGTVTDIDGDPVEGVPVYLINEQNVNSVVSTTTDSNGNYIFESHPDVQTSTDTYIVAAGGYDSNNNLVTTSSNPNVTADLRPSFFDVSITSTNSPIVEGNNLNVNYSVTNTGGPGTQNIVLDINGTQEDLDAVTLDPSASTNGTLTWSTVDGENGSYTANVESNDTVDSVPVSVEIGSGKHYYYIRESSTKEVEHYQLSTRFDISNKGTIDSTLQSNLSRVDNMIISNDGKTFLLRGSIGTSTNSVEEYSLSTPFYLNSASLVATRDLVIGDEVTCFEISDNGRKLYVNDGTGTMLQYDLSTPYDIGTRNQSGKLSIFPSDGPGDPAFSPDGSKVAIGQRNANDIIGGTLSTPFDIDTFTQDSSINAPNDDPSCAKWNEDGTKLLVRHASPDMVNQFVTSNPYSISGMNYDKQVLGDTSFAAGGHDFNYSH